MDKSLLCKLEDWSSNTWHLNKTRSVWKPAPNLSAMEIEDTRVKHTG